MANRFVQRFVKNAAKISLGYVVSSFLLCPLAHAQRFEQSGTVRTSLAFLRRPVTLSGKDISFAEALQRIAQQGKILMVCDGVPVTQQTDFESKGTLEEALDKLGELYDLEWTATNTNTITLRKRFRNKEEYAQVYSAEMLRTCDDVLKILDVFKIERRLPRERQLPSVYYQLSDQHKTLLAEGKRLPVTDIPPMLQQQLLHIVVQETFSGTLVLWQDMKLLLQNLPNATVTLRTVQGAEKKEPHFDLLMEWEPRGKGKVTQTLLSFTQLEFTELLNQFNQVTQMLRVPYVETKPLVARRAGDPPSLAVRVISNGSPQPLSQLARHLSEATGYQIYVAEPLRERHICLASTSQTAKEILTTVCSLLDLQWQKTRSNDLEIVLPRRDTPRNVQEAARLISKALPTEWRTLFGSQISPNAIQARFPEGREAQSSSMSTLGISNSQRGKRVIADSHIELVRYLTATQKVDKPVMFSQLNALMKAFLIRGTVYRLFFDWGAEIDYPVYDGKLPNYVAHFDKAYLDLRTEENQRRPVIGNSGQTSVSSKKMGGFTINADGAGDGTTYLGFGQSVEIE